MMICRVMLGTILIGMVSTQVSAMQAMRRAATMGPQVKFSLQAMIPGVSRVVVSSQKQQLQRQKVVKQTHGNNMHFAALGLGLGLLSSYKVLSEEGIDFQKQQLQDQKEVLELLHKESITGRDESLLIDLYRKGSDDLKKYIEQSVDFTHLEKYGLGFLNIVAVSAFKNLDEQDQQRLITELLHKDINTKQEGEFIQRLYANSSQEVREWLRKQMYSVKKSEGLVCPTVLHEKKFISVLMQKVTLPNSLLELTKKMILESDKNLYRHDRVTFFHGQAWHWHLKATLVKKLYESVHKTETDDNHYYFLRFFKKEMDFDRALQEEVAQNGVKNYLKERGGILFANLALFANGIGSNSVEYVYSNSDQSTLQDRNNKDLLDIFKEYEFEAEIKQLIKEDPKLLIRLQELHGSASKYGNFVTITIPKELASHIAYPARSGGTRVKYCGMHSISEIVDNFHHMPFNNEFCIVLGPNMWNPIEAEKAGIEIKSWNTADPKIITERDALIDEIIVKCVALRETKD